MKSLGIRRSSTVSRPVLLMVRSVVNIGNFPHLILAGPPGVGKTSTVLCMARMLLGDK